MHKPTLRWRDSELACRVIVGNRIVQQIGQTGPQRVVVEKRRLGGATSSVGQVRHTFHRSPPSIPGRLPRHAMHAPCEPPAPTKLPRSSRKCQPWAILNVGETPYFRPYIRTPQAL